MSRFDWDLPYPSQREPVLAANIVATSQPLAAQAGLHMLRAGGNAADAAIAMAIAMTVLEPTTNGIGSDAFSLAWFEGRLYGINGSGRAPGKLDIAQFAGMDAIPMKGWGPVTVPGAVSAWVEMSTRFGKLPFIELFTPAIEYCTNGFPVAPQTARLWQRAARAYTDFPEWGKTFLVDGQPPREGQVVRFPDHARTLQRIAESIGRDFYEGELAQQMAAQATKDGAPLSMDDLKAHAADWVEPISIDYQGVRVHEIPPNGQGIAALMALGMLRHFDVRGLQVDCPDVLHLQIEAMKLAFADAHRYVADPKHMDVTPEQLLDAAYLESRSKLIDPNKATDFRHGEPKPGGTILLCAADAQGNMVSFIQSQYSGFGSGIVIPGTGIGMQNRGACFTLEEGHPNQVAPGKRPYHTIIPGFATKRTEMHGGHIKDGTHYSTVEVDEQPIMAFGVMGGFMQPQGHMQVVSRIFDHQQNPQAALDAPRWQVTKGLNVTIEPGFGENMYEELRKRGHALDVAESRSVSFGRGQVIYKLDGAYCGASDLRADGQAVGY
jgi:gamma-glutamyltranspeptidase/glutathione hydrolase